MKSFLFALLTVSCFINKANAQSIEEQMTRKHPSCNDVFLNAIKVFPKLYKENAFDSMYTALQIWEEACGQTQEVKTTGILLNIQQATFTATSLDSSIIDLLESNARSIIFYQRSNAPYFENQKAFYQLSAAWAKILIDYKPLNETEKFICQVFAGAITDPAFQIKNNPQKYPQLAILIKKKEAAQRNGIRSNVAFITGIWMPTGNLKIVGKHPSVGFQVGMRDTHNEFDLTMQFRFIKSANTYSVKRNNLYYDSDAFFGGYIGLDYTYFLMSEQKTDIGLLAGIGYDGFDVFKGNNDQDLKPLSIGSFNANGGLRFNFYVSPTLYLGLQGRYNWIKYNNKGATSMSGNAFTIDFLIGGNKGRY
jgi:hypothetical protein